MPYVPHLRCTALFDLGPLATPREQASCTVNFRPPTVGMTDEWLQSVVEDCFTDWATFVGSTTGEVSHDVTLRHTKLWKVDATGHVDGPTFISTGGPVQGGGGGAKHPWQDALVVTLDAGGRGKGRFGRFYLPPQVYQINSDGRVADGDLANIWEAVQLLCSGLSDAPLTDAGFGLVVAGRTGVAGTLRDVTKIRLGGVVDTQRRRRRSLDEAYYSATFTP